MRKALLVLNPQEEFLGENNRLWIANPYIELFLYTLETESEKYDIIMATQAIGSSSSKFVRYGSFESNIKHDLIPLRFIDVLGYRYDQVGAIQDLYKKIQNYINNLEISDLTICGFPFVLNVNEIVDLAYATDGVNSVETNLVFINNPNFPL